MLQLYFYTFSLIIAAAETSYTPESRRIKFQPNKPVSRSFTSLKASLCGSFHINEVSFVNDVGKEETRSRHRGGKRKPKTTSSSLALSQRHIKTKHKKTSLKLYVVSVLFSLRIEQSSCIELGYCPSLAIASVEVIRKQIWK